MPEKKTGYTDPLAAKSAARIETKKMNDFLESLYRFENSDKLKNMSEEAINSGIRKYQEDHGQTIASIFPETKISNITDLARNSTAIINHSGDMFKNTPMFASLPGKDKYTKDLLETNFFDIVTGKNQTGTALMKHTVDLNYQRSVFKNGVPLSNIENAIKGLKTNDLMIFDFETLGAQDIYGRNTLDGISEYSFKLFDPTGKPVAGSAFESIIGLDSDKLEQQYIEEINNMRTQGTNSSRANVLLSSFYKFGHKDTEITKTGEGLYKPNLSTSSFGDTLDFDTAIKGVKRSREYGRLQESEGLVNGLKAYERDIINAIEIMTKDSTTVSGHNINDFDIPALNRYMHMMSPAARQELKTRIGGNPALGENLFLNLPSSRVIDTLELGRTVSSFDSMNKFFNNETLGKMQQDKLTGLQQETLVRALFPKFYEQAGAAHSAGVDVDALSQLFFNKENPELKGKSFIEQMASMIQDQYKDNRPSAGKITGGNKQLLMATGSIYMNNYNGKGAINFVEDSFTGLNRTFGGQSFGNGNTARDINQYGIKRKGTYTVDEIMKLDLTNNQEESSIMKAFKELHPEYAQGSIFYAKMNPVYDAKEAKGLSSYFTSPVYLFGRSQNDLENQMSSMFDLIGEADESVGKTERLSDPNAWKFGSDEVRIKDDYTTFSRQSEAYHSPIEPSKPGDIIKTSTRHIKNDPAAREERKSSYKRFSSFRELDDALSKTGDKKAALSKAFDDASAISKEINTKDLLKKYMKVADAVTKAVKGLKIQAPDIDLNQMFKYTYSGAEHLPYPETVNKFMTSYDNYVSQSSVINPILDYVKANAGTNKKQQDFMFAHLLNQVKEQAYDYAKTNNPESVRQAMNNMEPLGMFKNELGYFEINLGADFFNGKKGASEFITKAAEQTTENVLKVNLKGDGYDVLNSLLSMNYSGTATMAKSRNVKNEASKFQLTKVIDLLKANKETSEFFKDFERDSAIDENFVWRRGGELGNIDIRKMPAAQLSKEVVSRLNSVRSANPDAGFITNSHYQNVLKDAEYAKFIGDGNMNVTKMIEEAHKSLPNMKFMDMSSNGQEFKDEMSTIVKNVLMPNLEGKHSEQFIKGLATKHGFNSVEQQGLNYLYKQAQTDLTAFMTDFATGLGKTGASLFYDPETNQIGAEHNGKAVFLDKLPKVQEYNGSMYLQVGNTRVGLYGAIDMENGKPVFTTNIRQAHKELFDQKWSFKRAAKNNNILSQATSNVSSLNKELASFSSIGNFDMADKDIQFWFDTKKSINMIEYFDKTHKAFDNKNFRVPEVLAYLKREGLDHKKIAPEDLELLAKNYGHILQTMGEHIGDGPDQNSKALQHYLKNLRLRLKDVQTVELKGAINDNSTADPLHQYINPGRPVINQTTRAVQYRESEWEARSKKILGQDASKRAGFKNLLLHNTKTQKAFKVDLGRKDHAVNSVNLLNANMADPQYRLLLADTYEKKLSTTALKDRGTLDKVYQRLSAANLYEQEEIIDSRVAETFFHKSEIQKVSARKNIAVHMEANQKTLDIIKEQEKLIPQFEFKDGKIEIKFGKGKYVSRRDVMGVFEGYGSLNQTYGVKTPMGKLNFGYFHKNNILATSEEIMDTLKKGGINLTESFTKETRSKANAILGQAFDSSYYVESILQNDFFKMSHSGAEKGMAWAPYLGIGETDSIISKALSDNKNDLIAGKFKAGDLHRQILSDKFLDDEMIPWLSDKTKLSKEQVSKQIQKERHSLSNFLFDDAIGDIDGKRAAVVMRQGIGKHENVNMPVESLMKFMSSSEKNGKFLDETLDGSKDTKRFRDIFGSVADQVKFKDGSIIIPSSVPDLNKELINKFAIKKGLSWTDTDGTSHIGKGLQRAINGRTMDIGNVTLLRASQSEDNTMMTSRRHIDYDSQIEEIKSNKLLSGKERTEAIRAIQSKSSADAAISRGFKVTGRELLMMDFNRTHEAFGMMQKQVNEKSLLGADFEKIAGHMMKTGMDGKFLLNKGQYVFNEAYDNQSMLQSFSDDIRKQLFYKEGDTRLTDKVVGEGEYSHLKYINDAFSKGKTRIGINQAEKVHALLEGEKASQWNAGNYDGGIDNFLGKNKSFKPIDLDKVVMPISEDAAYYRGHPESILDKSSVIDAGVGNLLGENERYIAMPQMPAKFIGDDMVKAEFQTKVKGLQTQREELLSLMDSNETGKPMDEAIQKKVAKYKESISTTKQMVANAIYAKKGILHEMSGVRMDQSIMGKASASFAINLNDKDLKAMENGKITNALKEVAERLGGAEKVNFKGLSDATFMGESLLKRYSKGEYVDAMFMSQKNFEELGFFDADVLKRYGLDTEGMANELRTKGTMGVTGRYPTIYDTSIKPAMMYLSDDLHGLRMKMTAEGQLSAAGDNDGDNAYAFLLKKGKEKDYLRFMRSPESLSEKDREAFKTAQMGIMNNARGINQYHHREILGTLAKDIKQSISEDVNTITSDQALRDTLFGNLGVSNNLKDVSEQTRLYGEFEGKVLASLNDPSKKSRLDYKPSEFLAEADKVLGGMGETERDKYFKATAFNELLGRNEREMLSKMRKNSIGAANIPLFNMRKASELFLNESSPQNTYKRHLLQEFATEIEQEVISSKHNKLGDMVFKTKELQEAYRSNMYKNDSGLMNDWLNKYFMGADGGKKIDNIAARLTDKEIDLHGKTSQQLIGDFTETIKGFNSFQMSSLKDADRLASSLIAVTNDRIDSALTNMPVSNSTTTSTVINTLRDMGLMEKSNRDANFFQKSRSSDMMSGMNIVDGREWLSEGDKPSGGILNSIGETFTNTAKSIGGKNLAFGALGLAGAFMVAGYVGGNPSRPAETHAADEVENDSSQFYTAPSLQDPNLAQPSGQTGYVININAKTKGSRQQVSETISRAISSGIPTDVNVAMNIKEDPGNISDRYIQQLMAGAIQ